MTKRKAESSPEVVIALDEPYLEVDPSTAAAHTKLVVDDTGPTGPAHMEGGSADHITPTTIATLDGTEDLADTTF